MTTHPKPHSAPPGAPFPPVQSRHVVDIDAVDDVAGTIRVNGREITVRHLDAAGYRALQQLRETGTPDLPALYATVARSCPDLSSDEVDALTGPKLGAIIAVAEIGIQEVESALPNAPGPTETTATTSSLPA